MTESRRRRSLVGFAGAILVLAILASAFGSLAQAKSPILHFSAGPTANDNGNTQAGGHSDLTFEWRFGSSLGDPHPPACHCNDPKTLTQNLPAGFIGNPHATPRCTSAGLAEARCPVDSQIGVVAVLIGLPSPSTSYFFFPLYNMVPNGDQAGLIAFNTGAGGPILTVLSARTGSDYGLRAKAIGLPRGGLVMPYQVTTYLWGVPADPSHNGLRYPFNDQGNIRQCTVGNEIYDVRPYLEQGEYPPLAVCPQEPFAPQPSSSPLTPLLSNPTRCSGPLSATLETFAYDNETDFAEAPIPAITGCDQLTFNPSLSAKPTTTETDSASGLDVDLSVPQVVSATTPSPSEIKASTVTLPVGFSINPNAASGKATCSDEDAHFGTEEAARCPEFSKIGTLTIDSSALPTPIPGYLYLGDPLPGDRYRVVLVADGFGTHIKLAGSALPDPQTGQLTFSFPSLPESPLTNFSLHIFGSERGILATPTQCGTYAVNSTFTPWDEALPKQSATQFFTLDQGPRGTPCPARSRVFSPSFSAASAGNTGGSHSPFGLEIRRDDGDQNLSDVQIKTPPGFVATLKGVPYCPESAISRLRGSGYSGTAELASASCPAAAQVGMTSASVGAGSKPLYVSGKVYLAGPYKGAPLSLVAVVPAVSGPYDLGNVAVRVALSIDPVTAQVTAVSDPLPKILDGIPLRIRSVQINLNRPDFTLNPTNCDPSAVNARIEGNEGAQVDRGVPFQVANCATLPFGPRLNLRLSGGLNRRGHPAIHADLLSEAGEANLRRVVVTLPKGELLDNAHIGTVCTRVAFAHDACPKGALIGRVEVTSPLLAEPLAGPIYLRSSQHQLPDLALDLEGQIDIEAVGKVDSVKGRLRTSFDAIPDVPVSRISVDLAGGAKGLLQNSKGLCGAGKRARVRMTGQNGANWNRTTRLELSCGSKSGKAR
jgi:hypothetical protein